MSNIEKIATFISECDYGDFVKALILHEKEYLFDNNDLTKEQKDKVLNNMYTNLMDNNQGSLLGDEHSNIIENTMQDYIEDLEKNNKIRRKRQ
ncbi:hypothetical protein LMG7974_01578 [Campylobacter majalis]|uniref:DUF2018 family protein n=1 Tax=Campylobacter majalis TaxID=2790656 RepID=A0ABM8Q9B1_9BACT|nr:hypothetical protein [Campylobacter majalis]CAD7289501.1 hypothetical protein LMG7974_01578 [Campylobacter majalis]